MSIWILIDDGRVIADINLCVTGGLIEKARYTFFRNFNASLVKRQSDNQILIMVALKLVPKFKKFLKNTLDKLKW